MHSQRQHQRSDLVRIATHVMAERGLEPEFSRRVEQQLAAITGPGRDDGPDVHDLTHLLWCSIDNDDSLDLDQLTVCEPLPSGAIRLWVAIADVDALVKKDTPIDAHALLNTTSVYTSARIFPMLPERLCTDLTSLNPAQDRLALVTEMVFNADASLAGSTVYRARVHNRAKLAYDAVSAWIDGELPAEAAAHVEAWLNDHPEDAARVARWADDRDALDNLRRFALDGCALRTHPGERLADQAQCATLSGRHDQAARRTAGHQRA